MRCDEACILFQYSHFFFVLVDSYSHLQLQATELRLLELRLQTAQQVCCFVRLYMDHCQLCYWSAHAELSGCSGRSRSQAPGRTARTAETTARSHQAAGALKILFFALHFSRLRIERNFARPRCAGFFVFTII